MGLSNSPSFENIQEITANQCVKELTRKKIDEEKINIEQDRKLILNLAYLTTLSRLPENSDLDELFDGEVQLGEEELLAIYGLLEILNGNHTIKTLKSPQKMGTDWNWAQDYESEFNYEKVESGTRIKSIISNGSLHFKETKLNFYYGENSDINKLIFERPINLLDGGGFGVDQEISIKRNKGLVTELQILRGLEIANKLSIRYNNINKPELIEQTKLGLMSDKILFEYDIDGNLKTILYLPTLSLKHLKGPGRNGRTNSTMKSADILGEILINGIYTTFQSLKMLDSCDIIEISTKNGLPTSTKTTLNSSRWFYENGFSNFKYNNKGELQELYLEKEEIGPDDKKNITVQY